jgi:hypothetical protein
MACAVWRRFAKRGVFGWTATEGSNETIIVGNGNDNITIGSADNLTVGNGNNQVSAGSDDQITIGNGNDSISTGRRLREMVRRPCLCGRSGSRDRGAALGELPAIPAATEAGKLLGRSGHGEAQGPDVEQLAASSSIREEPNMKPVVASAGISCSAMLFTIRGASTHDEPKKQDWTVISMKGDWKRIFAFE